MALINLKVWPLLRRYRAILCVFLSAVALLILLLLKLSSADPATAYERDHQLFLHGQLEQSQLAAERDYRKFVRRHPDSAVDFRLLEAETMLWRGMYDEALTLAGVEHLKNAGSETRRLAIESVALIRLQRSAEAARDLDHAQALCQSQLSEACGDVLRARGLLFGDEGRVPEARQSFLDSLSFARSHKNTFLEASAYLNLGWAATQADHYDEAVDWLWAAYRTATQWHADDLVQRAIGNLGWAFFSLGDSQRALEFFLQAEKSAAALGDLRQRLNWMMTAGNVYQENGDLSHAFETYQGGLGLARHLRSNDDIVNALEVLAHASVSAGRVEDAETYLRQLEPMVASGQNRVDQLYILLARARIAALDRRNDEAEAMLQTIGRDKESQISMRLAAEHELALLYQSEGKSEAAEAAFKASLSIFESARSELRSEELRLPYLTNARDIYDDYIHFLVSEDKTEDALSVADQSRAQTLLQGLQIAQVNPEKSVVPFAPAATARRARATLLFYWLGRKSSFLWAITPDKVTLFKLPSQAIISSFIDRYQKALQGFTDPVDTRNPDGMELYRTLIAPAASYMKDSSNVIVFSDGVLDRFNLETVIVPDPTPHYWIQDATVVSASSLRLVSSERPTVGSGDNLLLVGDAVSPNADYPQLPMAALEMKTIRERFSSTGKTILNRENANPQAYLASTPENFAYIHFVAHGVASETDPLSSAIILSRSGPAEDSFKLHAREIMQHSIHARLVTISACYGSGTRSYTGEGVVGLAWAFLRAGAHNVIGSLWEVSDEASPRMMGVLYQRIHEGDSPGAALRQAKLSLVNSKGEFHKPFYWGSLQMYAGN